MCIYIIEILTTFQIYTTFWGSRLSLAKEYDANFILNPVSAVWKKDSSVFLFSCHLRLHRGRQTWLITYANPRQSQIFIRPLRCDFIISDFCLQIYFKWWKFPTVTSPSHCSLTHPWFKSAVSVIGNIISVARPNMLNHWVNPVPALNDTLAPSNWKTPRPSPQWTMNQSSAVVGCGHRKHDSKDKKEEL